MTHARTLSANELSEFQPSRRNMLLFGNWVISPGNKTKGGAAWGQGLLSAQSVGDP